MTEMLIPIYDGKPEDFRWAGFGSGSGTNLRECAKVIPPALIFSDKPDAKLFKLDELAGAHHEKMNGFKICGSWEKAKGDPEAEKAYEEKSTQFNEMIFEKLQRYEKDNGRIDLIVLGGYMRFVKEPLLTEYKDRIINVHPSDLTILSNRNDKHWRAYTGGKAVYKTLQDRQTETLSSVIIVDDNLENEGDHGEIITQGPKVKIWDEFLRGSDAERDECLMEYADALQSFQKVRSDWPALTTALKMIAEGRVALGTELTHHNEWRTVYVDGKPMPYNGFKVVPECGGAE